MSHWMSSVYSKPFPTCISHFKTQLWVTVSTGPTESSGLRHGNVSEMSIEQNQLPAENRWNTKIISENSSSHLSRKNFWNKEVPTSMKEAFISTLQPLPLTGMWWSGNMWPAGPQQPPKTLEESHPVIRRSPSEYPRGYAPKGLLIRLLQTNQNKQKQTKPSKPNKKPNKAKQTDRQTDKQNAHQKKQTRNSRWVSLSFPRFATS